MDKALRLQLAADKIDSFADTIKSLDKELGQLCADIGDDLWNKVEGICPWHSQIGPETVKKLSSLARDLEPQDI
jgi:hypothetical protein